ncbi:hypothetical protein DBR42_07955 [Pelomonas sp. HMWF004]|nr:hypothetical protein DBR42_07955 [Pelomonas sp. HMWF004]
MKQAEDNRTAELPGVTKRGRKPLGERPMTSAERQKAYRARLAEERYHVKPAEVSRVTIMRQLADAFEQLDKPNADSDLIEGAAYMAEGLIAELVTRYGLQVHSIKRKSKRVTKI